MRCRILFGISFFFTVLAFLTTAQAQDSTLKKIVKWNAVLTPIEGSKFKITYKGIIDKGWRLYIMPEKSIDMQGLVALSGDTSVHLSKPEIISKTTRQQDAIFSLPLVVAVDSILFEQQGYVDNGTIPMAEVLLMYELADAENYITEQQTIIAATEGAKLNKNTQQRIIIPTVHLENPVAVCDIGSSAQNTTENENHNFFKTFLLGFGGGLLALLMPCIFPMIPLTVSFFTKSSGSKKQGIQNAFLYGFFIFLIYVLLSVPFHLMSNLSPETLNNISTNIWLNLFFFIIFVYFGFSLLGYYEINMPSWLTNSVSKKSGSGHVWGIFFMALTLAIVSFSCTGPILGSLLVGSIAGKSGAWQLTFGMAGFGLALALPFALFALFPNLLKALPKSGSWLDTLKAFLGFAELAMAFKFLSNADLAAHWNILKREIFVGIWIVIGTLCALYLFGILHLKKEQKGEKISKGRKILGGLTFLFVLYLIPGVTNTKYANLKLLSGFLPPMNYSIYKSREDSECLYNLTCTKDYNEVVAMAKAQNKAILIDFTGYACPNCRRMEENIWSNPEVNQVMKDKFIIASLYVDDKAKLPLGQRFTYTTKNGAKKEIQTVGDLWATFETENFNSNAQPLYVILSPDEVLLNKPVDYTSSPKKYLQWLNCGLDQMKKK